MEIQKKIMAAAGGGDRLSDLPEPILLHILSKLWDKKQVELSHCSWRVLSLPRLSILHGKAEENHGGGRRRRPAE
ncbi:hypothetical protein H5410_040264 [Solanum commersonii]|uniref:F-box domain-containing protein n=1 Tax=Solanum commersonii TaxID=4109 RepID=A0A9J5XS04_SOLCO|nr:hypothetical protein H5410_040264 [Solanum commersonii]